MCRLSISSFEIPHCYEADTFADMPSKLAKRDPKTVFLKTVMMDLDIATKENLQLLKEKEYT
ncbi:MAG TPA: hypothetical protein DDZ37_00340 [Spirochaetaceae bacterium]|nr:hypothetical protein [Spirochaetaceae bacterium]